MTERFFRAGCLLLALSLTACAEDSESGSEGGDQPAFVDPGTAEWEPVPRDQVAEVCRLNPDLLEQADRMLNVPWGIVRYGRLCHEFYPGGEAQVTMPQEIFSATKTLGALVVGIAAYQTRSLTRTGSKTGPLSDADRVDHWLDTFSYNRDARVGHVLGMVAHSASLAWGEKTWAYYPARGPSTRPRRARASAAWLWESPAAETAAPTPSLAAWLGLSRGTRG